jgi:ABC-2 type transport system permease protein
MLGVDFGRVSAVFRRDLTNYLTNPTGYVFITLFIMATAAGAFLQDGFFSRNLADLAELNAVMPELLMLFVPAVTMASWADERRSGTDELLLTMPIRDVEVVLGKYMGALGVYTVALGFSTANVAVLSRLGDPDAGLMVSTYLGYWLLGGTFVAIGLLASMFTANATVAFILGALGCAGLVFAGTAPWASGIVGTVIIALLVALDVWVVRGQRSGVAFAGLGGAALGLLLWLRGSWPGFTDAFAQLSAADHLRSFGEGIVRLGDVAFFVGVTAFILYLCTFALGRRHW